jgi:hypothetical protein
MRIAYVAPYQGEEVRQQRPIVDNLALAGNLKIELISELLDANGHQVEVLSQGEAGERSFTLYPAFEQKERFHSDIPVHYGSALPVRFVQGAWSVWQMLRLFRARHRTAAFDLVIVYNFKQPQCLAALYAAKRLRIPVVLEYEDDALVDVVGKAQRGLRADLDRRLVGLVLRAISGCVGVSPHLLSQIPAGVPRLLLRGAISREVLKVADEAIPRQNWVLFSGTHSRSKGLEPLLAAWRIRRPPGWQLHIAGHGELTKRLEVSAANDPTVVFHGLVNREENARLLRQARIGLNPHDVSQTPGNVFAFKIVEYLAAGAHVLTTPMGPLEPEFELGITYIPDNRPETIAIALSEIIASGRFQQTAAGAARAAYAPDAVAGALDRLVRSAASRSTDVRSGPRATPIIRVGRR